MFVMQVVCTVILSLIFIGFFSASLIWVGRKSVQVPAEIRREVDEAKQEMQSIGAIAGGGLLMGLYNLAATFFGVSSLHHRCDRFDKMGNSDEKEGKNGFDYTDDMIAEVKSQSQSAHDRLANRVDELSSQLNEIHTTLNSLANRQS